MIKMKGLNFLYLFSLLFLLSGKPSVDREINRPNFVAGIAKITGRITQTNNANKDSIFVNIIVLHPISGENVQHKVFVDQFGKFVIDVEVETDISLIGIYTSLKTSKLLFVKLKSGGVTDIDITYNSKNNIENIHITPVMNPNDVISGFDAMDKMIRYNLDKAPQPLYDKSTDYYLNGIKNAISEKLAIVRNDTLMSKELKDVLSNDLRLWMYKANAFNYKELMILNYRNTNDDKSKTPDIKKVDRNFFSFLKTLNLNDMQYLNCYTFQDFQKEILQNEVIGLPKIEESNITTWLKNVKTILSALVGFKDGPYYDILVANAYGRQLNEELRPLSEIQKKNIKSYWKNGEIAKILFRKNQKVVELNKSKSPTIVNQVSSVASDKVIEAILAKHKNKVVLIDFWATWCIPCLEAMQQFRSTKNEFHDKNVVFVYLTNGSSPRKIWEEKIEGIGGEHYYLNNSQWDFIMNSFGFKAIPSYLLYDKGGLLINKFTAFPENNKVKKMINDLL